MTDLPGACDTGINARVPLNSVACYIGQDRMTGQSAKLSWREGGVPVSTRFDDPYFSVADGPLSTS